MNDKVKILYVDDETINIKLFEVNFRKKYTILTAIDAIEGLQILEENPDIDVLISDMNMPIMNGAEFIKQAQNMFSKIKYFMLSGYEKNNSIQQLIDEGIILDYFKKPFNRNEIEFAIDNSLKD